MKQNQPNLRLNVFNKFIVVFKPVQYYDKIYCMGNDLSILDVINIQTPLGTFELISLALAVVFTLVAIWKSTSGPPKYYDKDKYPYEDDNL
jgi:hypothetical protein